MTYIKKDFNSLIGMEGFSDSLLQNHFTLYEGYVNNTNILLDKMNRIREQRLGGDDAHKEESAELHRRFSWEYNGMRLHELYFENLTKDHVLFDEQSRVGSLILKRFESYENFIHNFTKNVGMFRGIGWVVLVQRDDSVGVIWVNEHNEGLLADANILLVMDVFEHAFISDYGLKRAEYISAFVNRIDWRVVENRMR